MTKAYQIPSLPLEQDLETKPILRKLTLAHRALAELKGAAGLVPNEGILINTLSLQEARDSSAIENIVTTQDDLFKSDVLANQFASLAAKEVHNYARALREAFARVRKTGLITVNDILTMQATLEENRAGFRKLPGTELKNDRTGKTVYVPPQTHDEIIAGMSNLEQFINDPTLSTIDPLIKMAVVHHQFESIHPFYDGNGRTGRIINILYLVQQGLLKTPVLYLSRYINQNKSEYYRQLQAVRDDGAWEAWVMFMLEGVEQTSLQTTLLVDAIRKLMLSHKVKIRTALPRIYSQDLLNSIFGHPYSKIIFIERDLRVSRLTATKKLEALTDLGLMTKQRIGRENYYINVELVALLGNVQALWEGREP
ncbi:MAG: Fic family protein [Hyphomicrobiaceae bacterium]|nr:Fic family protein [Hyphomicrobiaceae bacterium]